MSALDLQQPAASPETAPAIPPAPRAVLLLLGVFGLATLAVTVAPRAGFAFPLEWMEGASLDHALRLLADEPVYAAPSAEFIAYLYPPLAYVPMALATVLFGPSLAAARGASLACTALALLAIGRAAARGSGSRATGCAAAGLFAIGFGYTGAFLDLTRVDACFVLLIALASERLVAQRPYAALAWLALSVFAKQHGLLLLAAVSVALLLERTQRRARVTAVAVAWLAVGASFAALELASAGFFARYTFGVASGHDFHAALFIAFFAIDLLLCVPLLVVSCARGLWLRGRARAFTALDALLLAAVIAGALGRAHAGGHDNVRLPPFALLCIAGCIELGRALAAAPAGSRRFGRVWLLIALALQFAMLFQPPSFHAPRPSSAADFAELRAALLRAGQGGAAVALDHARLTSTPFMHTMALSDLRSGGDAGLARAGTEALLARLRSRDAPAALAVGARFAALERVLRSHYRLCLELQSPRLTTGYQPGYGSEDAPRQQIYVRADLYGPARCGGVEAPATTPR